MDEILAEAEISDNWMIRVLNGVRFVAFSDSSETISLSEGFTITYGPSDTTKTQLLLPYDPPEYPADRLTSTNYIISRTETMESHHCSKCGIETQDHIHTISNPLESTDISEITICRSCIEEFTDTVQDFMKENTHELIPHKL